MAANVFANVCGVSIPVSVLAQQVAGGGQATCDTAQRGVFNQ